MNPGTRHLLYLDGRMLAGKNTGVGRYITGLAHELINIKPDDFVVRLLNLPQDHLPDAIASSGLEITEYARRQGLAQHMIMPRILKHSDCSVYHHPDIDAPMTRNTPLVITCCDIEPLRSPEYFSRRIIEYCRFFAKRMGRARKIIAISENTRNDLIEILDLDPEKISVILLAVDSDFKPQPADTIDRLRARYRLPDEFVLYVGNTMPHKNLGRLVEAMALVRRQHPEAHLVMAGAEDKYRPEVEKTIAQTDQVDSIRFLGKVGQADLPALYCSADVFAFPSLYEGFGLPALEAMACGTPVVASNAASIPEVVGEAGVIVDPLKVEEIAEGIITLLSEPETAARYARMGIERASSFTWRRCAEEHLDVYREVASRR